MTWVTQMEGPLEEAAAFKERLIRQGYKQPGSRARREVRMDRKPNGEFRVRTRHNEAPR
jgi:hypothetical protein